MARDAPQRSVRLPSGLYAWRGRAIHFARLPQSERGCWRSIWSTRAARTRRKSADALVAALAARVERARKSYRQGDARPGRKIWTNREREKRALAKRAATREDREVFEGLPDSFFYYH
jgi:hypothetical protein